MKKYNSQRLFRVIKIVGVALVCCFFFWIFFELSGVHIQSGSVHNKLEKIWGLEQGSLIELDGSLLIGPYKDLRSDWHAFIKSPHFLFFWLYSFTFEDAKRLFNEWGFKGVIIQGIIESQKYKSSISGLDELEEEFIGNKNIVFTGDEKLGFQYQHAKTFVWQSGFVIQTANLTYSAFKKNREMFFLSNNEEIRLSLLQLFQDDYRGAIFRNEYHPNIILCPENCRERIEKLLLSANDSLLLYQQYITDPRLQDIIKQKYDEGLLIQIILGDMGDKRDFGESQFLQTISGAYVFQTSPYVHAKAILIDNSYLVVTSMNMSQNSIDNNREIGILLTNEFHIERFMKTFSKDWAKALANVQ